MTSTFRIVRQTSTGWRWWQNLKPSGDFQPTHSRGVHEHRRRPSLRSSKTSTAAEWLVRLPYIRLAGRVLLHHVLARIAWSHVFTPNYRTLRRWVTKRSRWRRPIYTPGRGRSPSFHLQIQTIDNSSFFRETSIIHQTTKTFCFWFLGTCLPYPKLPPHNLETCRHQCLQV